MNRVDPLEKSYLLNHESSSQQLHYMEKLLSAEKISISIVRFNVACVNWTFDILIAIQGYNMKKGSRADLAKLTSRTKSKTKIHIKFEHLHKRKKHSLSNVNPYINTNTKENTNRKKQYKHLQCVLISLVYRCFTLSKNEITFFG